VSDFLTEYRLAVNATKQNVGLTWINAKEDKTSLQMRKDIVFLLTYIFHSRKNKRNFVVIEIN